MRYLSHRRRTSQPQTVAQINNASALARGLFTGFANPDSGALRLSPTPSTAGLPIVATSEGRAFSSASSSAQHIWTGNHSPQTGALTVLIRAMRYGNQPDSGFGMGFTLVQVSGTQDPFQWFMKDAGERVRFNTISQDTTDHTENTRTWPLNQWETRVYRYLSGTHPTFWGPEGQITASAQYSSARSGSLKEAASMRINNPALRLNGALALALVWNRALGEGEIANLIVNPWQVFA